MTPPRTPNNAMKSRRSGAAVVGVLVFLVGIALVAFAFLLAFFKVPEAIVGQLGSMALGFTATGLVIAGAFLLIGMFKKFEMKRGN